LKCRLRRLSADQGKAEVNRGSRRTAGIPKRNTSMLKPCPMGRGTFAHVMMNFGPQLISDPLLPLREIHRTLAESRCQFVQSETDNWGRASRQLGTPHTTLASKRFVSRLSMRKVCRCGHAISRGKVAFSHTEKLPISSHKLADSVTSTQLLELCHCLPPSLSRVGHKQPLPSLQYCHNSNPSTTPPPS
jgi:hypothetical protein